MTSLDNFGLDPTRFTVKVKASATRSRTFLFGSGEVTAPFQSGLILFVRVDPDGDQTTFYSRHDRNSDEFKICVLERGESFAVKLEDLISVSASATRDTRVHCALITDR